MVTVRTGWLLGLVACASACFVDNPLFIATGEGGTTGATTDLAPPTTGDPGTTGTTDALTTGPASTTMIGPACGNGVVEPGEQCDDGNRVPGDDCELNCRRLFRDFGKELEGSAGAVAFAVADLDLDGDDDLILGFETCLADQACIRTWDNEGDGAFAAAGEYPVGQPPARLFVADWVVDGQPDVLATHTEGYISLIDLQNPAPVEFAIPGDLAAAVIARVDDDPIPDLVVPDEPGVRIHYVLANGTSFTQPNVAASLHGPRRVAGADVDADGKLDVLYTIYAGDAGFAVKPGVTGADVGPFTSLADNASPIVAGEFATQPWPNVAYADPVGNTLQIFDNDGKGQFKNVSYTVTVAAGVTALRSVRLNTGSVDNIAALTAMGLQIFTYDEEKGQVGAGKLFPLPGAPIDFAAGALGGDDRPDLAVLTTLGCFLLINQAGE